MTPEDTEAYVKRYGPAGLAKLKQSLAGRARDGEDCRCPDCDPWSYNPPMVMLGQEEYDRRMAQAQQEARAAALEEAARIADEYAGLQIIATRIRSLIPAGDGDNVALVPDAHPHTSSVAPAVPDTGHIHSEVEK